MGWQEDVARLQHKEELIGLIQDAVGHIPENIRVVINALAHPDVIEHTKEFFSMQESNACQIFGSGWSCHRQAESKFGYNGEETGDVQEWCEPCLRTKGTDTNVRKAFSLGWFNTTRESNSQQKRGNDSTSE